MIVTRTLRGSSPPELGPICKAIGFIRADIWRRIGALGTLGKNANEIRRGLTMYVDLPIDGTIRAESTKDIVNDVLTYKAAAKALVRRAIAKRAKDEAERKSLFNRLSYDEWLADPFLHRQMRKHFRHGKSRVANQFVVRSDRFTRRIEKGRLVITISIAKKFGHDIDIVTTTNGKGVDLAGKNLRVTVKDGFTEIHYAAEKAPGRQHGERVVGVDKGYTEALTDSDGQAHGQAFGAVLNAYSDQVAATGKQRGKLRAIEKAHRAAGRIEKADRIRKNNLGRVKLNARRERTRKRLRTIAFQAAHSVVDKAAVVGSEDLSSQFASKYQWKRFNRTMSGWAKGVLAEALDSVCSQREAKHVLVNAAYTSQTDSATGLLQGKRVGDRFYRVNGDVLQADHNAAMNVLARIGDPDISQFMRCDEVRRILLARSYGATEHQGLESAARPPSAEKSHEHV
jgi:transposase